ncbi:hypothetical protein M8J76_016705 [Diaphorina citri]|nr:hypothetical protein M8J75_003216 [Diaphorina citri]KAI5713663.1 hypothetical protein M8J76_003153 [Diaphorina citri]KAI5714417.1 hypothetical protein M8J76_016705 [Diaphorina citri]
MTTDAAVSDSSPLVRKVGDKVKTNALFVTRFSPSVTSTMIKDIIQRNVKLSRLSVSKIQTRYQDSYSSFHVEVLASEFHLIDDENIWPDGCLIKQFYGKLLPQIIIHEEHSPISNNG